LRNKSNQTFKNAKMILVTGATGQFGKATIQYLLDKGADPANIKALVRNESSARDFEEKGVGVAIGDYDDAASLVRAFEGVDRLMFVSASDIDKRVSQHRNVVNAAKAAGVKHVVYTSFQRRNETESSPLWIVARSHLHTEQWLKESGLGYTILKNNLYMDFIPAFVGDQLLQTGVIYVPAGDGRVAAVLRSELAEAAANILLSSELENKTYEFTHSEAFSYQDVADAISSTTGKTISYISPTEWEYAETLAKHHVPDHVIGLFSSFAVAQDLGELDVVSTDLEQLLGRKPTTIKAFLDGVYS
jgi:NAD(P)H dehydrogenase (quinone)